MKKSVPILFAILSVILVSSASAFLFYRAVQFDINYPNPLTDELSAQTVKLQKDIQEDYRCFLPAESGECFGYIEKYYYNRDTNKCEQYVYGGCGAVVPFDTLDECLTICEKPLVD